jgi:hypothetical protein
MIAMLRDRHDRLGWADRVKTPGGGHSEYLFHGDPVEWPALAIRNVRIAVTVFEDGTTLVVSGS